MDNNEFVTFYPNHIEIIETFADPLQRLWIYEAITNYRLHGTEPTTTDIELKRVWIAIKPGIESQINRKAATARQNGKKGGRPRKQKEETPAPASSSQPTPPTPPTAGDLDSHRQPEADSAPAAPPSGGQGETGTTDSRETARKDAPRPPVFRPPTLDEVRQKAKELGTKYVNHDKFYNHYEGKEWKTPDGQTLTNWANKLLEWEAEDKAKGKPERATPPRAPSSATPPPPATSAGTKEKEHKTVKPADFIRSHGYDPKEWEPKFPEFLAMIREKEQQPTKAV